jgi:tetratricopeptide (TPR) repeat protein
MFAILAYSCYASLIAFVSALDSYSTVRMLRFQAYGNSADIDVAIDKSREAVVSAKDRSISTEVVSTNLGATLGTRFEAFGIREDLDECVAVYRAIHATTDNTRVVPVITCNFVLSLIVCFDITGDEADLDEALELVQRELHGITPGMSLYVLNLWNLGGIFQRRYTLHRRSEDLAKAISTLSDCLRQKQQQHARADRLVALAKTLLLRIKDFPHRTDDFDQPISLLYEALGLRPAGHPRRHEGLNALSEVYVYRFEFTGISANLDEAFRIQSESVEALPNGHTFRAQALFGLARIPLLHPSSYFNVQKALDLSIAATRDNSGVARRSLISALDVLSSFEAIAASRSSFRKEDRIRLLKLYQHIIELIPRVAFFGLDLESRLRVLAKADNVAAAGATHAIILDSIPVAIEMLEQGRGVFWTQALRLRTPLDDLPLDLAKKLHTAARRLETGTGDASAQPTVQAKAAIEDEVLKLRQISNEFDQLIVEARSIAGHERFLLHNEYFELTKVAHNGPVVLLLSGKSRCAAIILRKSGPPQSIHLLDAAPNKLLEYGTAFRDSHLDYRQEAVNATLTHDATDTSRLGIASRWTSDIALSVLGDLWNKVMWPIIQALGFSVRFSSVLTQIVLTP